MTQQEELCVFKKSDRFINDNFSDFNDANRSPIYGYENLPLLPLEQAVEKILPLVPNLLNYVADAKEKCNRSSSLLTWDESAGVYLYTMPKSFFSHLNKTLRDKDRHALKPWFAFLKLMMHALEKLPSIEIDVWRGISTHIGSSFTRESMHVWWSVNSCSTDLKVVECYLGEKGTLFAIKARFGKDISAFAAIPTEQEIIPMPGSCLYVRSDPLNFKGHLSVSLEQKQGSIQNVSE